MYRRQMTMVTAMAVVVGCSATGADNDVDPKPDPVGSSSGAGGNNTGGDTGTGGSGANSSGSGGNPGYASGSRLKARRLIGDDGAEQFTGWHDSMLGVSCAANVASDGQRRCLPFGANVFWYSDSTCTTPLAHTAIGCSPSGYATRNVGTTCDPEYEVREVQGTTNPGEVWYASGTMCISGGTTQGAANTFYALAPPISPDQFVAMTEEIDP